MCGGLRQRISIPVSPDHSMQTWEAIFYTVNVRSLKVGRKVEWIPMVNEVLNFKTRPFPLDWPPDWSSCHPIHSSLVHSWSNPLPLRYWDTSPSISPSCQSPIRRSERTFAGIRVHWGDGATKITEEGSWAFTECRQGQRRGVRGGGGGYCCQSRGEKYAALPSFQLGSTWGKTAANSDWTNTI